MVRYLLLILFIVPIFSSAQQTKILWLGNSYTYVNDLPGMFHTLALSGGDSVTYDSNTPGGYTLQQHSADATSIQKIYSKQWDYVIIQAQSQEPSFPPSQVAAQTYPYARILDSLIRDNDSCTETIFYLTWGKKYGDQQNCSGYPVLCTFDGVQSRLTTSYVQMGNDNHALIAPVGPAWQTSWHTDTLTNLWIADNSHPTVAGSYLAACVFYGTIFRKNPVGLSYAPVTPLATNAYLQNIAYHTVFDTLSEWNIGDYDVKAGFDFTGNETTKTYSFNNLSKNYSSFQWNYGDGNTGTSSGTHTYGDTGTYTVSLIAFDECGKSDTSTQLLSIAGPNAISSAPEEKFSLSPYPVKNKLIVDYPKRSINETTIEILDITGREVLRTTITAPHTEIDVSELEAGVYILSGNHSIKKFLKVSTGL